MNRYHAVARKVGSFTPFTVQFSAKDSTDAIAELCAAAGVQNTNGLLEFEILEVLPRGEYKRAALKTERKATTVEERLAAATAPVTAPATEEEKLTLARETDVYIPYRLEAA